jgi:putative endonuclease
MPYFVYILECKGGSLYTGYTTDLDKRVRAHNESKAGAKYTKTRRPVELKYFERFRKLGLALKREYEIKQLTREEKLELINKNR